MSRMSEMDVSISSPDFVHLDEEAVLSGYLHKQTRDGRWQRRWFETNGVYLTYYKSRKMEKLLAALSLPQVGAIATIPIAEDTEGKGGLFSLALNNRKYTLRAKTDEEAVQWVTTLTEIQQKALKSGEVGKARVVSSKADGKNAEFVKESRGGCCC